jgi:sugar transferase (PEP-CTERM/EpsH1 system associated)
MKILVLSSRYPYPVVGGDRLRLYEICRELSHRHQLTLLSLVEDVKDLSTPAPPDGIFQSIVRIRLPRWKSVANVIAALPGRLPLQVAYYRSHEFARKVHELASEHEICLAHLIRTGAYCSGLPIPTVLEMTDAISMNYERVRRLGNLASVRGLAYRIESTRLKEYERAMAESFPVTTLVSEVDKEYLFGREHRPSVVVSPNGVDFRTLKFADRTNSEPVIAYIGNMNSLQNIDACQYFAEDVLPELRKHIKVKFRVVGRIPNSDAERLRRAPNVEVTGAVPDVSAAVAGARIGVAPVRLGAGVQNKVLEYMALGLPVIASQLAAEGLGANDGRELLVANSTHAYVERILSVWENAERRRELATNGRLFVERCHDWSACLAPMMNAIEALGTGNTVSKASLYIG